VIQTVPVLRALSVCTLLLLAGGVAGCAGSGSGAATGDDTLLTEIRNLTASARDKVFPALVNIRVVTVSYYGGQENKGGGSGSGTIISPEGLVVTNAHVTSDGKKFFCTLADKQEITATMVGEDPATDLAVLKLNLNELKPGTTLATASWGNSDELQVGDNVLAWDRRSRFRGA
jgi:S1-C subfamily serine protease